MVNGESFAHILQRLCGSTSRHRAALAANIPSNKQGWADIIADVFPDLTKEDLALWKDAGVTFKMRRRYQKFVLLYFVPRSVSDKFHKIYLYFSASFVWYLLGGHS